MAKRRLQNPINNLAERLFSLIDEDNDKSISWEEFLAFQAKAKASLKAPWPFEISEIRKEFSEIDTDGSGTLSKIEFLDLFQHQQGENYDVSALRELESILDDIEKKKDGSKDSSPVETEREAFLRQMMEDFDRADLDGDGCMDFSEYIRKVWSNGAQEEEPITLRQLRRQFKKHDLDKDGKISRTEFRVMAERCFEQQ